MTSKMADPFSQSELFVQLQMGAHYGGDNFKGTLLASQSCSFNCKWLPIMEAAIFEALICKTYKILIGCLCILFTPEGWDVA